MIHLSNFRARWIIFSAICVLVISFRATSIQHYSFFFTILQSIIWKSSSFYSLVSGIILLIHDSISLLGSTFLELQYILNRLLEKAWRDPEVQIESIPNYPRALPFSNDVSILLLNHSEYKTKYASCACNRMVPVMCVHCCLAFRRVNYRFSWKRIIDGEFISQILSLLWFIDNRTLCRPVLSAIILVIRTEIGLPHRGRSILSITCMITNRIGLHLVLLHY